MIFDASVIFNFGDRCKTSNAGQIVLESLKEESELLIPPEVQKEVLRHPLDSFDYPSFIKTYFKISKGKLPDNYEDEFSSIVDRLDGGEIAVLILCLDRKGTAILDEKLARREAKKLSIPYFGTVGLLDQAVHKKWIRGHQALDAVKEIIGAGGRLPKLENAATWQEYLDSISS